MTLATGLFYFVALFTLTVNLGIFALMAKSPATGLVRLTHRPEQLPQVMTGRYLTFVVLTAFVLFYGDIIVLMGLLVAFGVAAFADTYIYASRGYPYVKHLSAGVACVIGIALCALALGAS